MMFSEEDVRKGVRLVMLQLCEGDSDDEEEAEAAVVFEQEDSSSDSLLRFIRVVKEEIIRFNNKDDAADDDRDGKARREQQSMKGKKGQQQKKRKSSTKLSPPQLFLSKKPKKRKSKGTNGINNSMRDRLLECSQRERQRFEQERTKILASLEPEYRNHFGRIGFVKWSKNWRPVVLQSPYWVSPDSAMREQWMKLYRENKQNVPFLCFWYGTENFGEAYTFQKRESIVLYQEGIESGLAVVPSSIKKKLDSNNQKKKLTRGERELVVGLAIMRKELQKTPSERFPVPVKEQYELMLLKPAVAALKK